MKTAGLKTPRTVVIYDKLLKMASTIAEPFTVISYNLTSKDNDSSEPGRCGRLTVIGATRRRKRVAKQLTISVQFTGVLDISNFKQVIVDLFM